MTTYTIRRVASHDELRRAFDVLGSQFEPPFDHTHRRFLEAGAAVVADTTTGEVAAVL